MSNILFKEESFKIIGACMEVHNHLGPGFKEIVYKQALEIEFNLRAMPFIGEKRYAIEYKGKILERKYNADFILYDSIILEVKSASLIIDRDKAQTINYLKVSGLQLGIVANFGEPSLKFKRSIF